MISPCICSRLGGERIKLVEIEVQQGLLRSGIECKKEQHTSEVQRVDRLGQNDVRGCGHRRRLRHDVIAQGGGRADTRLVDKTRDRPPHTKKASEGRQSSNDPDVLYKQKSRPICARLYLWDVLNSPRLAASFNQLI